MEVSVNRLKELQEIIRKIHESPENKEKRKFWHVIPHEDWEPAFIRTLPVRKKGKKIPFVVELGLGLWAKILDFDLSQYYHDPLTYAIAQLEMKMFHASHFHDDTFIEKNFRLLIATTLEGSIMGVPFGYTEEGHPWLDYQNPPLKDYDDLAALKIPDFYQSGEMPQLLKFYEEIKENLADDYLVKFPDWIMGPFGVAAELRGFDKLLMDMILEPAYVDDLITFIVESRFAWQKELDAYLGIERTGGLLGNDDVNCPTISPSQYQRFLLPVEQALCEKYGRIYYWHSCGQTTPLIPHIAKIPAISMFHCGPWTSVDTACRTFQEKGTALEVMVEPVDKVQMASAENMRKYLADINNQIPPDVNCFIKVDSIEDVRKNPQLEVDTMIQWIDQARDLLG